MITQQDVSWDEIEHLAEKLSKKLSRTFSSITTLSRGGLVSSRNRKYHSGKLQ